ncbi:MAG TPA: NAD(P)/FAD-dependent oxidoreductase [Acidimicrobiales bacterium]|nr:NAD(P)/FAD-dependent oxidoreductase [Acidimicrobiales bacterium]
MTSAVTDESGVTAPTAESTEHLDVLIVGAGLSGIGAASYIEKRCPWASYAVFEGRDAIGGTWDLFRYPGVRSDSDMFTLGYSFRPWDRQESIAEGGSILQYIKETAAATGVDRRIRFNHRVVWAEWSTGEARWRITAERSPADGGPAQTVQLTCRFLFSCTGYYRYDHGYQPDFPGAERFEGTILHPQAWPEDLDYAGKRVVVIGSGATAVTLVPSMAKTAGHVTMLQRSPTYIASLPARSPIAAFLRRWLPGRLADPAIRWFNALTSQGFYQLSRRRPATVKRMLRKGLERQLPAGYDIDTHFTPRYDPWDQRMCLVPDGDLFAAIREGTVSVVTDHIVSFTERGLLLRSGTELEADVVVTATGLELLFMGGIELAVDGRAVDPGKLLAYKGMMLEGVPNLALAFGYTNASWTLKADLTCAYVCRLLNHMRATGMRQCTPVNSDATLTRQPLLSLNSGYINRSQHLFPKQGSKFPWQVHQSYLRDYRALRASGLTDEAMVFSNPIGAGTVGPDGPGRPDPDGPERTERLEGALTAAS